MQHGIAAGWRRVGALATALIALQGCPNEVPDSGQFAGAADVDGGGDLDGGDLDGGGSGDAALADSAGPDGTSGDAASTDTPGTDGSADDGSANDSGADDGSSNDSGANDSGANDSGTCACVSDADCAGIAVGECQVAACSSCSCVVILASDGTSCGTDKVCTNGTCLVETGPGPWAKAIAAGGNHACALHPSGKLSCWGHNSTGQLGNGQNNTKSPLPQSVAILDDVLQVVAGSTHTCALRTGGTIWCWGDRFSGKTGVGDNSGEAVVPEQTKIITDGLSLACSTNTTLARREGQTLWGWGANYGGQFLDGSGTSALEPVQVKSVLDVMTMCTGEGHACALHSDGNLECWGKNEYGQAGHGDTGTSAKVGKGAVLGLPKVAGVSCGHYHTCAWDQAGKLWCWGKNLSGQLATGGYTPDPVPAAILVADIGPVAQVAAGQGHTCARTIAGDVLCWGDNSEKESGSPGSSNVYKPNPITLPAKATDLAAGTDFACALVEGGAVACWGENYHGQLGNGGGANTATAVFVTGSEP